MYVFDLHAKLRALNAGVYINTEQLTTQATGEHCLAVLRRVNKRKAALSSAKLSESDSNTRNFIDEETRGVKDEFLFAIPYPFIPEYDEIDPKSKKILKRGWRSIALALVNKKVCSLSRVRHVFQSSSLGESDYDKYGYSGKLARAKH